MNQGSQPFEVELPPALAYRLRWATSEEKVEITERLRSMGRQTMNLRIMPDVRVLSLYNRTSNELIGWCCLDYEYQPAYPELMSLHLDPSYRSYNLGLLLETARAAVLWELGFRIAYTRMEAATNAGLMKYRIEAGLIKQLTTADLPESFYGLCNHCECFQRSCTSQAYFMVNLEALLRRGADRLGAIDVRKLPQDIDLDPAKFRQRSRQA